MFPNVRLMVVAMLAAIAGIGCGLGLFATFRVNHEPLARLADGSPPLQLAFEKLGLNSELRAPLAAGLPVNAAAKPISVPVIPTPGPDHAAADAATSGDSESGQPALGGAADMDRNSVASVAAVNPAEQSTATREDTEPRQQDAAPAAVDQQASTPPSEPAASSPIAPSAEQTASVNPAATDEQPAASSPAAPSAEQTAAVNAAATDEQPAASSPAAPSAEQTAPVNAAATDEQPAASSPAAPSAEQTAVNPAATDEQPAASSPAAPTVAQTAPVNAAATDQEAAAKPAKPVASKTPKPAAIRAAHPAPPRRVARVVRARRTVTAAAFQPASQYSQTNYAQPTYAQPIFTQPAYTQPTYSWAGGTSQAAQPVKRVQIKRRPAAKKAAPAAQSNPSPATAGLSGTP
jgi:hypothetical protein